jgi:hypothetical protein
VHAAGPLEAALTAESLSTCFGLPLRLGHHLGRWSAHGTESRVADAIGRDRPATTAAAGTPTARAPGQRTIVDDDGRAKAYRPLGDAARLAALEAGLRAFGNGEYFEAHELIEPAWMGTDHRAERNLYQGVIKVAAAGVHATRGNVEGVRRNLEGARLRLSRVCPQDESVRADAPSRATSETVKSDALRSALARIDIRALLTWIDDGLAGLAAGSGPDPGSFASGQMAWDRHRGDQSPPGTARRR